MATRLRLPGTLVLAFSAGLLALPLNGRALNVVYDGTTYDLEIYTGSYDSQPSLFATPAQGGRMPWWGNYLLATGLASALADGLSPSPLPPLGPLFATAFVGANINEEVSATYFDLGTLGTTNVVLSDAFSRSSSQSYVVLATVPAPLPIAATTLWLTATKRLRRLSARLGRQTGRPKAPSD
ncbi:MAG: hypothetical protein VKO39_01340 [Cyanobacteriota bacterium]|nr:hypothetical protein [Cyanobacteriota bacterium]